MRAADVDPDALLAALVLAPGVLARNRFPSLYEAATLREVRRRARELRGFVHLVAGGRGPLEIVSREPLDAGGERITYGIASLRLEGCVTLSAFERALISVALARTTKDPAPDEARSEVSRALSRLLGRPPPDAQRREA